MSGGHFDYNQHKINEIIEKLEDELNIMGTLKPKSELYCSEEYYEKYPEEKYFYNYSEEIKEKFREGLKYLKLSSIYTQRIDWLLSGDDGEETFLKRLEEDLKQIK